MTKAADILHITQPTLSRQIKSLEDELGQKLFIRHSFHIELTEAGILLRKQAEDLLSMANKITDSFQSLDDISGGDLYFGLAESYQIGFLAEFILSCSLPGLLLKSFVMFSAPLLTAPFISYSQCTISFTGFALFTASLPSRTLYYIRSASFEKPSVFLIHGLRPMLTHEIICRL